MALQQGLIFLGLGVFTLILLDALRRKLVSRRQDKAAIRAEQEASAGLPNDQPDPLFDDPDSFADGFEQEFADDPIPLLSDEQLVQPAEFDIPFPEEVQPSPSLYNEEERQDRFQQEDYLADSYSPPQEFEPPRSVSAGASRNKSQANTAELTPENAWENMRRRFELDPSFAKASRVSMQEQQKELELLQEVKTQQALRYGVVKQQHFNTQHNDLEDLDLPTGLAHTAAAASNRRKIPNTKIAEAENLSAPAQQATQKPAKRSLIGRRVTNKQGVKVTLPSKPLKDRIEEQTQAQQEEQARKNEQRLRTQYLASLEQNTWGNASQFITFNLHAHPDKPFYYAHLQEFARATEMKFSKAGFYHFTEEENNESYLGYSMINMYNPGNFLNPNDDPYLSTQGLVLLTTLPSTPNPLKTFNRLLAVAKVIARNWDAELQDEHHSNLTQQTIEHYRQKIRDFEYRQRIKAIKK